MSRLSLVWDINLEVKMFKRIFISLVTLSLLTGVAFSLLLMANYSESTEKEMYGQLQNEAMMLSNLEEKDIISLGSKMLQNRITYIDADGKVLFDNSAHEDKLESHKNRPEIISARENGVGKAKRYSASLSVNYLYYAILLDNGDVLRLSTTITGVGSLLKANWMLIIISLVVVISLIFIISLYVSNLIVKPINNIDLDDFKDFKYYTELSPLIIRIKDQKENIKAQALEKAKLDKEFFGVLDNIKEGLIIIDGSGNVININKAALDIFSSILETVLHHHYLSLTRSKEIADLVSGKESVVTYNVDNQYYRASITKIPESDNKIIVLWDITDKFRAELMRTEFTANASHELKTPMTVIKGYAEILENGLCKKEDEKAFLEKIDFEATRLASLVEDIINLSALDETKNIERADVELDEVVSNVTELLSLVASNRHIELITDGDGGTVYSNEKLLFELIYNLVDNAIKYNKENGKVTITLAKNLITISDNGIGIPKAAQARIFERFYRVDKSHSREIGGTGLGLSIVKHIASLLDISIKLESEEGVGTTFKLYFKG